MFDYEPNQKATLLFALIQVMNNEHCIYNLRMIMMMIVIIIDP